MFLVVAFGVRTVIHLRRVGRSGWLVPPTPAAFLGDGLFALGVGGSLAGSLICALRLLEPFGLLDHVAVNAVGVAALAGGATFALIAQAQMGPAWRAGIDVSHDYGLVTRGVFALVRNPFYLGTIVAAAGVFLMAPNLVTLTGGVAVVAGCLVDVRFVEEPHLRAAHGDAYAEYARRVPRFVPSLSPKRQSGSRAR